MGVDLDWSQLGSALRVNPAAAFQSGMESGRQMADAAGTRQALSQYFSGQNQANALAFIGSRNPALAFQLDDRARSMAARNSMAELYAAPQQPLPTASPSLAANGGATPARNALTASPPPPVDPSLAGMPGASGPASQPQAQMPQGTTQRPQGGYAPPDLASVPGKQAAWADLARNLDPEHFMALRKMDVEQRTAYATMLDKQLEVGGQVFNGIRQLPPEQQEPAWQQVLPQLEAAGITGLPDHWDPQHAVARLTMGMKVADALREGREAANTTSEIQYRTDETAIGRDRNRIDETNNIRTNATSTANNVRTNATSSANNVRSTGTSAANNVRSTDATISNNRNRPAAVGVDATGHTVIVYPDNRVVTTHGIRPVSAAARRGRQGGGAGGAAEGATATGPGGHKIVVHGGRWVDAQTGQPVG